MITRNTFEKQQFPGPIHSKTEIDNDSDECSHLACSAPFRVEEMYYRSDRFPDGFGIV